MQNTFFPVHTVNLACKQYSGPSFFCMETNSVLISLHLEYYEYNAQQGEKKGVIYSKTFVTAYTAQCPIFTENGKKWEVRFKEKVLRKINFQIFLRSKVADFRSGRIRNFLAGNGFRPRGPNRIRILVLINYPFSAFLAVHNVINVIPKIHQQSAINLFK
jgi:hypothetical protein